MKKCQLIMPLLFALSVTQLQAAEATNSLAPKEYSELHIAASDPKDPKWAEAMRTLAKVGDGFTVDLLKPLQSQKLDPAQAKLVDETLAAVRDRASKEDVQAFAALIQFRLERAAWADLTCNKLEGALVSWTMRSMREHLKSPDVVAKLKALQAHYVPSADAKTSFGSMEQRVPSYVARLLAAAEASGK